MDINETHAALDKAQRAQSAAAASHSGWVRPVSAFAACAGLVLLGLPGPGAATTTRVLSLVGAAVLILGATAAANVDLRRRGVVGMPGSPARRKWITVLVLLAAALLAWVGSRFGQQYFFFAAGPLFGLLTWVRLGAHRENR